MEILTIKELKALIADMEDDAEVYIANGDNGDTFTVTGAGQDDDGDLIIETILYCS